MKTYNNFEDIRRHVSDQPLETDFYTSYYIEGVAWAIRGYLYGIGWEYGDELPEAFDEVKFWSFFEDYEIENQDHIELRWKLLDIVRAENLASHFEFYHIFSEEQRIEIMRYFSPDNDQFELALDTITKDYLA